MAIGLVATCNPGGASKWRPEFSEALRGRSVVILADNDAPGHEHAHGVAQSLAGAIMTTPTIKVVTLPNLPPKGDVSDWLERGGTREALEAIATEAPEWTPPDPIETVLDEAHAIAKLNAAHAVIRDAGKTVVINHEYDPVFQRRLITQSSFSDLRNFYGNQWVETGHTKAGTPIRKRLGHWWLDHPDRRQYDGLVCAPGDEVPGYFNLWQGFAVDPAPGDWARFTEHCYEIICGGNTTLYDYVIAYLADAVQHPGDRAEVALVLRGARGTGKGIFARTFGGLFGQHFVHVAHSRHLTGHFNSHLRDAVVVFADEAFFPGDKQGEGGLKMLITEPTIPIERKGQDVVVVKNLIHLILASNHDWVIPAGLDERRFCVLDVSDTRQQDHDYFKAIVDEMDHGGRAAMLYDLLHYDLAEVNLRHVPTTAALIEQKLRSMTPNERWWFQKLDQGQLLPDHDGWVPEAPKVALYQDYLRTLGKIGVRHKSVETELGMFLAKMLPAGTLTTCRKIAVVPTGCERSDEGQSKRLPHWRVPSLEACREAFDRLSGSAHPWVQSDDDDDGA